MRSFLILALLCITTALVMPAAAAAAAAGAGDRRASSLRDRVDDLQQEVESLTEDIEDLGEPVEEFELFDQCMYTIGVTEFGTWNGAVGYLFGHGGQRRRPALAIDMRGFGIPQFDFLAFPGEEPPSIECNEDAGEEFIDD
jgi:hypothetical protein